MTTPANTHRPLIMYSVGFIGSLILTVSSYTLVTEAYFDGWTTAIVIAILAMVQTILQLLFFLHLKDESRPRWQLWSLVSMLIIFVIVVFGSIWVMHDLNSRMMPTHDEMLQYMDDQAGF